MKKNILFIYPHLMIGGSTTSLLSVLNLIDYNKYNVDILFYDEVGVLEKVLPKEVNILPVALQNKNKLRKKKLKSVRSICNIVSSRIASLKTHKQITALQFTARDTVRYCRILDKEYDVAISYLELWPMYYLADKVKAKKKISWIHLDYIEAGFTPKYDLETFRKLDKIVLVSQKCLQSFQKAVPKMKNKSICIENILSKKTIDKYNEEEIKFEPKEELNIITVCRIVFYHKGLDRAVNAFKKLKDEGILDKVHWYIIGNGQDYNNLKDLIEKYNLKNYITLLGEINNPVPYVKKCDVFLLPSRYEGKPMAVTEAQMCGVVPIVTEYSSAVEQIENGKDGLIFKNDTDSLYKGLKNVFQKREIINKMKLNVKNKDFSNVLEMEEVNRLIKYED